MIISKSHTIEYNIRYGNKQLVDGLIQSLSSEFGCEYGILSKKKEISLLGITNGVCGGHIKHDEAKKKLNIVIVANCGMSPYRFWESSKSMQWLEEQLKHMKISQSGRTTGARLDFIIEERGITVTTRRLYGDFITQSNRSYIIDNGFQYHQYVAR